MRSALRERELGGDSCPAWAELRGCQINPSTPPTSIEPIPHIPDCTLSVPSSYNRKGVGTMSAIFACAMPSVRCLLDSIVRFCPTARHLYVGRKAHDDHNSLPRRNEISDSMISKTERSDVNVDRALIGQLAHPAFPFETSYGCCLLSPRSLASQAGAIAREQPRLMRTTLNVGELIKTWMRQLVLVE